MIKDIAHNKLQRKSALLTALALSALFTGTAYAGVDSLDSTLTTGDFTVTPDSDSTAGTYNWAPGSTTTNSGATLTVTSGYSADQDYKQDGGSLVIDGNSTLGVSNSIDGGSVTIGGGTNDDTNKGTLNINTGGSIAEAVDVEIKSDGALNVLGGDVVLNTGDQIGGKVELNGSGADLTLKGITTSATSGYIKALTGDLTISGTTATTLGNENDSVAYAVNTVINQDLIIKDGSVSLDSGDTISALVNLNGGKLSLDGVTTSDSTGNIKAESGDLTIETNEVTLGNANDSIAYGVKTTVQKALHITKGSVELDKTDTIGDEVHLDGGKLSLDGVTTSDSTGNIKAENGDLTIETNEVTLGNANDSIAYGVKTTIKKALHITKGSVELDKTDTIGDEVHLDGGRLSLDGVETSSTTGNINAENGNLTIEKNAVTFGNANDVVEYVVQMTVNKDINVENGNIKLNDDDTFAAGNVVKLSENSKGTLWLKDFSTAEDGVSVQALAGAVNITGATTLDNTNDVIEEAVKLTVNGPLTVKKSKVIMDSGDSWVNGSTNAITATNDGSVKLKDMSIASGNVLKMDSANAAIDLENTDLALADASWFSGGVLNIDKDSKLRLGANEMTLDELNTSGFISSINGKIEEQHILGDMNIINSSIAGIDGNIVGDGKADFGIDLYARSNTYQKSDYFTIDGNIALTDSSGKGIINISEFSFAGDKFGIDAPIDRDFKFKLFDVSKADSNITFTSTAKDVESAIGTYRLFGGKDGEYTLSLVKFNPKVFRAQVTTLAQYQNQVGIADMLTDHFVLLHRNGLANIGANKYALATPTLGPYQSSIEQGGLWIKNYAEFERLSMNNDLGRVHNNSYGSIIGADLPLVSLSHDFKFIPTAFVGYNGAHQAFHGVSAYQNGGQLGFMGTFVKGNYIGSHTIYGGLYSNEMELAGKNDDTMNWFVGTAHKLAYNWNVARHFIIQPNIFMAYNMFGSQKFNTDYGCMGMRSGMLNGINIAPGMNFIYSANDWSMYIGAQYMYNINDSISGQAGNVTLPGTRMEHGYIQYGVGGTKNIKDNLAMYGQVMLRNGGRTGVALQAGLQYNFDWADLFRRKRK